jgi:parallel beta-helix repeat protein
VGVVVEACDERPPMSWRMSRAEQGWTGPGNARRTFLRCCLVPALLLPAAAVFASGAVARSRGRDRVDVRTHGARGDGIDDDTGAFQDAIDALPDEGGTVHVPAGDYLLDPVRSVHLRDRMHLSMAAGARLLAKPNAADRAYVLSVLGVDEVEISGGRIIGERGRHLGTTGEWGHGVMIRGASNVTVRDLSISRCWGDGISIGGLKKDDGSVVPSRDVVIAGVRCGGNRRQGLTIGRSRQVRVYDSQFVDTGGALPGCGIDVEPDPGDIASGVVIANCVVRTNRGAGIQLYKRVSDVTIRDCIIEANRGDGVLAISAENCVITNNRIRLNGLGGIRLRPGTRDVTIDGNAFADNGPVRMGKSGQPRARTRHLSIAEQAKSVRVGNDNRYGDRTEGSNEDRHKKQASDS